MTDNFKPVREADNYLVYGSPLIGDEEIQEVHNCLASGWLGTGPKVAQFEADFSAYKNAPYVAALNSCTAALHLSMLAAGLGPGDEVITTPLTFCATINAIIHAGATPVLADIDPRTHNINPELISECITERTKAILPVHFAGLPCDMDTIMKIAKDNSLAVIEDCAHAIESEYNNQKTGTIGDFGCFSFYVTKNVVTGEGGMVIARNKESIDRIKILGLHGLSKDAWKRFGDEGYKHYQVVDSGFKYNMMDIQAAIGIHQLKRIDDNWLRRQQIWAYYNDNLKGLPIILPPTPSENMKHAYHLYSILIDESQSGFSRDEFLRRIDKHNIGVGVHYISIPEHKYYREKFNWKPEDYPVSYDVGRKTVSLPLSAKLTDIDVEDVIEAVRRICA